MQNGFIVLHRKMIEWEWFKDINTSHLFLYCILRANHKSEKWRGITIDRGSFITSLENISKDTGLSVHQVRTALNKLKMTGEVASKTTSRYSIISIKNYNLYQDYDKQLDKQVANRWQTDGKQVATNNNDNNDNNDNNVVVVADEKEERNEIEKLNDFDNFYGEYKNVHLTKHQYDTLYACILDEVILNELIDDLSEAIARGKGIYKPYDPKNPDKHFADLKAFWRFRYNNPEKFWHKSADTGGRSKAQEAFDEYFNELERAK